MKKQDEGFTLIELLIVIVILGILATVVVFSVRGITDDSKANSCQTEYRTMEVALEAYFAQYGGTSIPTQAQLESAGLIRDTSANSTIDNGTGEVGPRANGECVGIAN
ncbi:MAG: type II secretion system protein [Ilumatobacteraceae bacterium]|nr:type II secretion system protein [Ilumatobacteraceae bacterium]